MFITYSNLRMGTEVTKSFTKEDTSAGIHKQETRSIAELSEFISNSNEQTQEAVFLCKARVVDIIRENGWSYISCARCTRKIEKYGTTLRCTKCNTPNVTGVVRYRVEFAVHDGQDKSIFIVFDSEMTKLTNKPAATLMLEVGSGGDENDIPSCIQAMIGKAFLFQIRVTPFNFTQNHRTFTVSNMTNATTHSEKMVQVEQLLKNPTFNTALIEAASYYASAIEESRQSELSLEERSQSSDAKTFYIKQMFKFIKL